MLTRRFFPCRDAWDCCPTEDTIPKVIVLLPCRTLTCFVSNLPTVVQHLASVPTHLQSFKYSEPALSSCWFPHEEVKYVFDIHSLHICVTGHALNEKKYLTVLEATPGCPHELTCQSQLNCVAQEVPFMSCLTYLFLTLRMNPKWKQDFTFIDSDSFFFLLIPCFILFLVLGHMLVLSWFGLCPFP